MESSLAFRFGGSGFSRSVRKTWLVRMAFNNPYTKPFQLTSITRSNPAVTLKWESVIGQPYRVEASTNLTTWSTLSGDLVATGTNYTFNTNLSDPARFFRVNRVP